MRHPLPSVALLALIAAACSTGDSSTSTVAEPDPAGEDTTGGESTEGDQTPAESDPAETPVGPPTVETVTYPGHDLQLEGDLHLPASPGPHPAVVLTYDKHSCGTFNGCAENSYPLPDDTLTTDTFAADAQAGVEYLRTRDEVNPKR